MLVQDTIMRTDIDKDGSSWEHSVNRALIIHTKRKLSFAETSRRVMEARLHNGYLPSPELVLWLFDRKQVSTLKQINSYLGNDYVKGILSRNTQAK